MDKETFISLYNAIRNNDYKISTKGIELLKTYIIEEGNDVHKQYGIDFLNILTMTPSLYKWCLLYVLDFYVNKLSVVKLFKPDTNWPLGEEHIIAVY